MSSPQGQRPARASGSLDGLLGLPGQPTEPLRHSGLVRRLHALREHRSRSCRGMAAAHMPSRGTRQL